MVQPDVIILCDKEKLDGNLMHVAYSFDATVKVTIYDDLLINFSDIADFLKIWHLRDKRLKIFLNLP